MKRSNLDPRTKGKAGLFIALSLWAATSFAQTDTLPAIQGNIDIGGTSYFSAVEKIDTTKWYCVFAWQDGLVRFDSLYCVTSGLWCAYLMGDGWGGDVKKIWFTHRWRKLEGIVILMRSRQIFNDNFWQY